MPSEWNERWTVLLECKVCKAQCEMENPDASKELAPGMFGRLVLIGAPEVCPKCKSLRIQRRK